MTLGIIGGGQLGMMLSEAAMAMGYEVVALDPNPLASVKHVKAKLIEASFDDIEAIKTLYNLADVICYEFENIDLAVLNTIKDKLPQGMKALDISRDRIKEKAFAQSLNIPTPKTLVIKTQSDLKDAFFPSILKTTRFGYDGKGQFHLNMAEDVQRVTITQPMILEEKITFDQEVSVILTRDCFGNIAYYPLIKNTHQNGILSTSLAWWDAPNELREQGYEYGKKIIEDLDYIGTLAIEFFVVNNTLIFNEMAPRPHNSGHFSIEGTTISQFENMVLALTQKPVITPKITKPSMMVNQLGQDTFVLEEKEGIEIYYHDYYKNSQTLNRKIGHVTLLGHDIERLRSYANKLKGEENADETLY